MSNYFLRAVALATLACSLIAPASAATTKPRATPPPIAFPKTKLHTDFNVEVNAKGQVVLVKSGKSSSNRFYNAQTYGNVLQMWIRHPDGSAQVGTYHVTYDYDPKAKKIRRGIALISAGGNWGNKEGAADEMMDIAQRQEAAAQAAQAAKNKTPHLPDINSIMSTPTPKPKH
jgi:hypothetical protein